MQAAEQTPALRGCASRGSVRSAVRDHAAQCACQDERECLAAAILMRACGQVAGKYGRKRWAQPACACKHQTDHACCAHIRGLAHGRGWQLEIFNFLPLPVQGQLPAKRTCIVSKRLSELTRSDRRRQMRCFARLTVAKMMAQTARCSTSVRACAGTPSPRHTTSRMKPPHSIATAASFLRGTQHV